MSRGCWDGTALLIMILCYGLLQDNPPYNKGAFKIEINFPAEYPFKPPKVSNVGRHWAGEE